MFLGIIAGDLINNAPVEQRAPLLNRLLESIRKGSAIGINDIKQFAVDALSPWSNHQVQKRLLVVGEPLILYNSYLNEETFVELEKENQISFAPLSEALLMLWKDHAGINDKKMNPEYSAAVESFERILREISVEANQYAPFVSDLERLREQADRSVGYYSGAFGRYRSAVALTPHTCIDGVISVSSTYENSGISINTLHKGCAGEETRPLLNLTFDGLFNENTREKVQSFLFYL